MPQAKLSGARHDQRWCRTGIRRPVIYLLLAIVFNGKSML